MKLKYLISNKYSVDSFQNWILSFLNHKSHTISIIIFPYSSLRNWLCCFYSVTSSVLHPTINRSLEKKCSFFVFNTTQYIIFNKKKTRTFINLIKNRKWFASLKCIFLVRMHCSSSQSFSMTNVFFSMNTWRNWIFMFSSSQTNFIVLYIIFLRRIKNTLSVNSTVKTKRTLLRHRHFCERYLDVFFSVLNPMLNAFHKHIYEWGIIFL